MKVIYTSTQNVSSGNYVYHVPNLQVSSWATYFGV